MLQLPEAIARPSTRQLKQFAVVLPLAVLVICWAFGCSGLQTLSAGLAGAAVALIGLFYPAAAKPIYIAASLLAYPIGRVVSELVMLAVYFGLITPIGLVFRCRGRDGLERAIDRDAPSYWRVKKQPGSVSSYLRRW